MERGRREELTAVLETSWLLRRIVKIAVALVDDVAQPRLLVEGRHAEESPFGRALAHERGRDLMRPWPILRRLSASHGPVRDKNEARPRDGFSVRVELVASLTEDVGDLSLSFVAFDDGETRWYGSSESWRGTPDVIDANKRRCLR
jgi:hypothetical protein